MAHKLYPLQVCSFSLFLLSALCPVRGYIGITLNIYLNYSAKFENYSSSFADTRYSSAAEGTWYGYLLQVHPDIGCPGGQPHPRVSDIWIAVFKQYPYCYNEAVHAVRQAGFELMLIGDYMNNNFTGIGNPEFPVAIISRQYASYLVDAALSNITSRYVIASVDINGNTLGVVAGVTGVVGVVAISVFVLLLLFACVWIKFPWSRRSLLQGAHRVRYNQLPTGTGMTYRSNLTSRSDVTSSLMLPLPSEQIEKMPSKTYKRGFSVESCGICLEELKTGEKVRDLPCGHNTFHVTCLDDWLEKGNRSCPSCRHNVTRDRGDSDGTEDRGDSDGTDTPF